MWRILLQAAHIVPDGRILTQTLNEQKVITRAESDLDGEKIDVILEVSIVVQSSFEPGIPTRESGVGGPAPDYPFAARCWVNRATREAQAVNPLLIEDTREFTEVN